jgi:hypothetical protein
MVSVSAPVRWPRCYLNATFWRSSLKSEKFSRKITWFLRRLCFRCLDWHEYNGEFAVQSRLEVELLL